MCGPVPSVWNGVWSDGLAALRQKKAAAWQRHSVHGTDRGEANPTGGCGWVGNSANSTGGKGLDDDEPAMHCCAWTHGRMNRMRGRSGHAVCAVERRRCAGKSAEGGMSPRKKGGKEVVSMALVRHGKAVAWMDLGPCVTMGLSKERLGFNVAPSHPLPAVILGDACSVSKRFSGFVWWRNHLFKTSTVSRHTRSKARRGCACCYRTLDRARRSVATGRIAVETMEASKERRRGLSFADGRNSWLGPCVARLLRR